MQTDVPSFGGLIRDWRQRRRMSQLDLACDAEISARHLSFLETGRSAPSRDMVLRLAERLETPLRARNRLLLAAGYAPSFPERSLADPALGGARAALEALLAAHEPFPALAVDRGWNLVAANRAVAPLRAGVSPVLLEAPANVLRLSLHPEGMAPRIENLGQWRAYLLNRLSRQVEDTADPDLANLLAELTAYPAPKPTRADHASDDQIAVPLRLHTEVGLLSFWSTTMVFDAAQDVTVSELVLETFLPADSDTSRRLTALMSG
jgi:transcriptional regulator with XRE-family HTH domain